VALLASIVDSSEDAIIATTTEGILTSWNRGAENIYGYSAEEVIGKPVSVLIHADRPNEMLENRERIRRGQRVEHYETTRVRKDGTPFSVSLTVSAIRDSAGTLVGFSSIARDITERKRADEKVRATSQYARSLIEASLDPLVTISPEGKITDVNAATIKVTGVPREKLIGTDFSDYFTEPEQARKGYRQVFSDGSVTDYPLTIHHKEGGLTDVLYNASLYKNARDEVLGVFAAARDVTTQKHASQYARSLIEASADPLVTISPEGKVTDVNEATTKVTGVPRQKLIGTDFSNYFTEPEQAREGYQRVFAEGFVTDYPLTIRHQNGRLTEVLYNASVYKDVRGNVLGVFAAARDVTAQKHASQYARSLIEASLDPLVTISPEGKITDVNEATAKVTGVPREKLIGTDFLDYFTEPIQARQGYQQVFAKGFVTDYPLTIRHQDGELTDVLYNASVYKDSRGSVLGVFAAARNVTDSKRVMREFSETKNLLDNILQSSIKYSIIGKDLDHRILSWNEGARRNYGYTAEEVLGKNSEMLHAPEDRTSGAVTKLLDTALEKGLAEAEVERVRKDGTRFAASVVVTRRNDPAGNPIGFLLMSSDISERMQAEEQLRSASQYARSLIEASVDPLVTISKEGKVTDVNEATIKVTGVPREELIGTDFSNYFTEPAKAREGYQRVFAQGTVTDYPLTIRHKNRHLTEVLYNASVYKDARGNVLGAFAAARDVTAQKRAEAEIAEQRSKEMERLSDLERFQKLTVGRELKMIELKKEIEHLKTQVQGSQN
jgi:PAS domain S-box-containing protein